MRWVRAGARLSPRVGGVGGVVVMASFSSVCDLWVRNWRMHRLFVDTFGTSAHRYIGLLARFAGSASFCFCPDWFSHRLAAVTIVGAHCVCRRLSAFIGVMCQTVAPVSLPSASFAWQRVASSEVTSSDFFCCFYKCLLRVCMCVCVCKRI